ncbi:MAG: glycosyltransferase, partial [Planctomycetes bacterium]|nr:glycosyltransferase [Planctomycetota bacterium]
MRILHVLDHSIPLHSGYAFRTRAILEHQRARGWETFHLTTPRHTAPGPAVETVEGLEFHRTSRPHGIAMRFPVSRERAEMRATTRRLAEVVHAVRPDVIHAHSPILTAIPALRVGRAAGIPVVYEIRAFWEDAPASHGSCREGDL